MTVINKSLNVIQGPWGDQVTSEHIAKAQEFKPQRPALTEREEQIWDALAPEMVMLDRLKPRFSMMFAEWCRQNARIEYLREWLETNGDVYETTTRNGNQVKSHPYVAQVHEHWRQMLRLTEKFGLTPSDEKALVRSVLGDLVDDFGDFT